MDSKAKKVQMMMDFGNLFPILRPIPLQYFVVQVHYFKCNSLIEEYQGNLSKLQQNETIDVILS